MITKRVWFFLLIFSSFISLQAEPLEKNRIIVCDNGLEMFHWDLDFISEATQSVEVLACFFGGEIALELLEALERRLLEIPELQVHILASPIFLDAEDSKKIKHLQRRFPQQFHIEFSTQIANLLPDIATIDNHVKMFVVDETYFSIGGTNLEEKHCSEGTFKPNQKKRIKSDVDLVLPSAMRDQDIIGKGPIAKELRLHFFKLYSLWEHYNKTKILKSNPEDFKNNSHFVEVSACPYVAKFEESENVRELKPEQVKIVLGGPHQKMQAITKEYLRLIASAKKEIILEHLYFLPIDPLLNALMDAVNRGVKLTLVTNGISEISPYGLQFFGWGNRLSYVPMFYGSSFHFWEAHVVSSKPIKNTEIFEYHVEDVFLHKKIMLVDGKTFVIGSYNFGIKSAYGDYEIILVIDSAEIVHDVLKVYERDLKFCRKITPEMARSWYFDPLISYWGKLQKNFSGFL